MAALPSEGFLDIRRRLRILRLTVARTRLQRQLYQAETELGWLAWEQVDFFDEETEAHVKLIQEYENTQASLQNAGAELSGRKYALEEEVARLQKIHDETQQALAEERATFAGQLQQAEATRTMKLNAVERFERAIEELADLTRDLEARSRELLRIDNIPIALRVEEREIGDHIKRIAGERRLVLADKATAAKDATNLESTIDRLRGEVHRIDLSSNEAREKFEETTRRLTGETRVLDREKEKSSLKMANLDREKQKPYRYIGACLADHSIAPRNQPQILSRVVDLRGQDADLAEQFRNLRAECDAVSPARLAAFYAPLVVILLLVMAIIIHFL